jgi:dihydropteroate synthase
MNKKLQILAQRRERLVLVAAKQRAQLAQAVDVWRAPLALADQGLAAMSFIRKHPILMAGGTAVLVRLVRKSFIGKWFSRGMIALQLARKLHSKFFA